MKNPTFTAITDIGLDIYPKLKKQFPSGTALNSAYFASLAGARASVISAVGTDKAGFLILEFMKKNNINTDLVEQIKGKTDSVKIFLDQKGKPRYEDWDLGILTNYRLSKDQKNFLKTQDIVVGIHHPEVRGMFDDFAGMNLSKTIKLGDFTDLTEYQGNQQIMKEYKNNLDIFALSIDEKQEERLATFEEFIQKNNKMGIALLGEYGSKIFYKGKYYSQKAIKTKVVDTTGAGDSYLSTFIVKFFDNKNIPLSMKIATKMATKTIQHLGAII